MEAVDALLGAIGERNVEAVALLLEGNGNLVHADMDEGEERFKPLKAAILARSLPIVQLLVEKGADVNTADGLGTTCLHQAAHIGHVEILSYLLEQGADVANAPSAVTALMYASVRGHVGVVERLIQHTQGADVDQRDSYGRTALSLASAKGHLMVVRRLLPFTGRVAIDSRNASGGTALYFACRSGHVEVATALLLAGADPTLRNGKDESPKEAAERQDHPVCVALLDVSTISA